MVTAWAVLASLSGCGITMPDALGVQSGEVSRIYPEGAQPASYPDCLVEGKTLDDGGRYVEILFRSVRAERYVNAYIPSSSRLEVGDRVEVSDPYCVGSHKPRVRRVLPPQEQEDALSWPSYKAVTSYWRADHVLLA